MVKKAVILTIGNEILSGDVLDDNSNWIAKRLFNLGVELFYIFVLPDNKQVIKKFINDYRKDYDFIITVGGMGPTPDDVTKDAVAEAFNVKLVRNNLVVKKIQEYYQGEISDEKLLMAVFPETSEPIYTSNQKWAVGLIIENVYSFPGTPFLVRDAFPTIESSLKGEPIFKTKVTVNCEETRFTDIMTNMVEKFPDVDIGSYPSNENFQVVKLVFKSRDKEKISECREQFIKLLAVKFPKLVIS